MYTYQQWLSNVILKGITLDEVAICDLATECQRRYDLNAAQDAGFNRERLIALYVAAHLAPAQVLGISASGKKLKSRREGKVSETFVDETKSTGAAWEGTTWGQEFKEAMDEIGYSGGMMIAHAD